MNPETNDKEVLLNYLNKIAFRYEKGTISETAFLFKSSGACEFAREQEVIGTMEETLYWLQAKQIATLSKATRFEDPQIELEEIFGGEDSCGYDKVDHFQN